jgi:nucleoside-diphosphate kinase
MSAKTNASEPRYTFFVEWFDKQADLIRRYQLTYFLRDDTVEMYDIKNRRMFLKRSTFGHITAAELYLGAILNVYSRQVKVVEYADVFTRNELEDKKSRTLALVKPDAYPQLGKIINEIYGMGFVISGMKMVKLSREDAEEFYASQRGQPHFGAMVDFISSDVVTAIEVVGDHAIHAWREKIGASDTSKGDPNSLRAIYGTDELKNALHGSDSITSARNELEFFFSSKKFPTTAIFNNCTCAVIRPHALRESGQIIERILAEGFEVSALEMQCLSTVAAEEFMEVYKGVLPEYHDIVKQMCSGPVIAMEVRQENAVDTFRNLVGPHDPEIARHLRPNTIRGQYGLDRVQNALHCSDLPEDGLLEVEYFFKMLPQSGQ